jgi:Protein of unknown function (DUF3363)
VLRRRELDGAGACIASQTGLAYQTFAEGESVTGIYRRRVTLACGRFAMIDDGLGFRLVPWQPALERRLGRQVSGVADGGGRIAWSFGRRRARSIAMDGPRRQSQCGHPAWARE